MLLIFSFIRVIRRDRTMENSCLQFYSRCKHAWASLCDTAIEIHDKKVRYSIKVFGKISKGIVLNYFYKVIIGSDFKFEKRDPGLNFVGYFFHFMEIEKNCIQPYTSYMHSTNLYPTHILVCSRVNLEEQP